MTTLANSVSISQLKMVSNKIMQLIHNIYMSQLIFPQKNNEF